jgi:hypothetical protein
MLTGWGLAVNKNTSSVINGYKDSNELRLFRKGGD